MGSLPGPQVELGCQAPTQVEHVLLQGCEQASGLLEVPPLLAVQDDAELRAVNLDGHRVLSVVWVFKCKLEELSRAQRGIQCVVCGDGLAQHAGNVLSLGPFPVGVDDLQVP